LFSRKAPSQKMVCKELLHRGAFFSEEKSGGGVLGFPGGLTYSGGGVHPLSGGEGCVWQKREVRSSSRLLGVFLSYGLSRKKRGRSSPGVSNRRVDLEKKRKRSTRKKKKRKKESSLGLQT